MLECHCTIGYECVPLGGIHRQNCPLGLAGKREPLGLVVERLWEVSNHHDLGTLVCAMVAAGWRERSELDDLKSCVTPDFAAELEALSTVELPELAVRLTRILDDVRETAQGPADVFCLLEPDEAASLVPVLERILERLKLVAASPALTRTALA